VLPVDFTLEQGHLTPSMKLRRNVIADAFRDEISAIYP
jgi:long-chain acyl-CoA synthetase